jgi:hypothetical protein
MHLIYRTRRFQFTEIEELPNRAGWAISAKEVKNVRLSQVLNINVGDNLNLNEQ